jgi:hypothetical protein
MKQIGIITMIVGAIVCFIGIFDPLNMIRGYGFQTKEIALMVIGGIIGIIGLGIFVYTVNKKIEK